MYAALECCDECKKWSRHTLHKCWMYEYVYDRKINEHVFHIHKNWVLIMYDARVHLSDVQNICINFERNSTEGIMGVAMTTTTTMMVLHSYIALNEIMFSALQLFKHLLMHRLSFTHSFTRQQSFVRVQFQAQWDIQNLNSSRRPFAITGWKLLSET